MNKVNLFFLTASLYVMTPTLYAEISYPPSPAPTAASPTAHPQPATEPKGIEYTPEVEREMTEALKAAQDWVKLIDQGQYEESWNKASPIMQKTIPKKEWARALDIARKKLGPVKTRELKNERPAWDPNRLPKGIYMVVEYNTAFARATHSGELLTMRKEADGQWKVLTYLVN